MISNCYHTVNNFVSWVLNGLRQTKYIVTEAIDCIFDQIQLGQHVLYKVYGAGLLGLQDEKHRLFSTWFAIHMFSTHFLL